MYQITDFNLFNENLLISVTVDCSSNVDVGSITFSEGRFADIVRRHVRQALPATSGRFVLIGRRVSEFPVTVRLFWNVCPLWWADHPLWHEAPFCGEKVPEKGWFSRELTSGDPFTFVRDSLAKTA